MCLKESLTNSPSYAMSFISVDIIALVLQPFLKSRIPGPGRDRVVTTRTGVWSQPGQMFWSTKNTLTPMFYIFSY